VARARGGGESEQGGFIRERFLMISEYAYCNKTHTHTATRQRPDCRSSRAGLSPIDNSTARDEHGYSVHDVEARRQRLLPQDLIHQPRRVGRLPTAGYRDFVV
jgi:hypothetical protein